MEIQQLKKGFKPLSSLEMLRVYLSYLMPKNHGYIKPVLLPTIHGYKLDPSISIHTTPNKAQIGVYLDEEGNRYFAKQISRKAINLEQYWFRNEAKMTQIISEAYLKFKGALPISVSHIKVPAYYGVYEDDVRLVMITEMIDGESLDKSNAANKTEIIDDVLDFISELGRKITKDTVRTLLNRDRLYFFATTPFLCILALVRSPKKYKMILSSAVKIFTGLDADSNDYNTFVHRDISYGNVIKAKDGSLYLVDFELAVITNPTVELANVALNYWIDDNSLNNFNHLHAMKVYFANKEKFLDFKTFTLYYGLHSLIVSPEPFLKTSIDYLSYINTLS